MAQSDMNVYCLLKGYSHKWISLGDGHKTEVESVIFCMWWAAPYQYTDLLVVTLPRENFYNVHFFNVS